MTTATAFRAAIGAAIVLLIIGLVAVINHFAHFIEPNNPHPLFGLKVGVVLILLGLASGIYANYNRPGMQA